MAGGGNWGAQSNTPTPRDDANRGRLIARAVTLFGELQGLFVALGAVGFEVPAPAPAEVGALKTKAAAHRLGMSPYTLNELARRGVIPARQDAKGGPRHFRPADLEAYETKRITGCLANGPDQRYETVHDEKRRLGTAAPARHDAAPACGGARRDRDDGGALGTRPARRRPTGNARPYAPGRDAWATTPPSGDDDEEPES